jgi:arylformamidase
MLMNRQVRSLLLIAPLASLMAGFLPAQQPKEKEAKARPSQEAALAKNTIARLDVAYGKDEKQRLDVYSPRGVRDAPVVIFIHGGEWTRHDKAEVSFKPRYLNENGIVFVSINYRLTPAVTHPAHVNDVAAAVRWVSDHAAEIGGNEKKLFLMGHSAGCHLATLVALDPRPLVTVKLKPTALRGVIAWSGGAYDLMDKVAQGDSYAGYIKKAFGESETVWRDASPVTHARNGKEAPAFLFVSTESGSASHKAAENLTRLIRDAGGKADSRLISGRDHFNANHLLGAPEDETGKVLLEFVREGSR